MKRCTAILAAAGFLALAYCAFIYIRAYWFQAAEKSRITEAVRAESQVVSSAVASEPVQVPEWKRPNRGDAVAMLTIPWIGLSSVVLEGAGARELRLGPGHIARTPLPGEGGNFAVAGHRDTFFRALRSIRTNDIVHVKVRDQEFAYRVVSTRIVSPKDVQVLDPDPSGKESLTLVTCYPFSFVGSAPMRFIVRADCDDCLHKSSTHFGIRSPESR